MDRDCPEPKKEEGANSDQEGEDSQIQLNLAEEDIYRNVEGFELFSIVF